MGERNQKPKSIQNVLAGNMAVLPVPVLLTRGRLVRLGTSGNFYLCSVPPLSVRKVPESFCGRNRHFTLACLELNVTISVLAFHLTKI